MGIIFPSEIDVKAISQMSKRKKVRNQTKEKFEARKKLFD
jgi:hypothetical protein